MIKIVATPMAISARKVFLLLFLSILLLSSPAAGAQDLAAQKTNVLFDKSYPLLPPDTSSPRDTLRSFLTNINLMIDEWRQSDSSLTNFYPFTRASKTLDFSTTPQNDSWSVRVQYNLLLKEILDRIDLPSEDQIPGDNDVAKGDITKWTIPDTQITIARIEDGPRVGEFLFSAETVKNLKRSYRNVKHLPYKHGDAINFYEEVMTSEKSLIFVESQVRNRLKQVDTSSPRSTLLGFLDSVCNAYKFVMETDAALRTTPPTMTQEQAIESERTARNLLRRAATAFDLSQTPKVLRKDIGLESVLQLKEIIDRMLLPPVDSIPDIQMVENARIRESQLSSPTPGPFRWRYPNTEIEIIEIMEGEQQGQFLFSASSVNRIGDLYERIRDLPYFKRTSSLALQYEWPYVSEGFYNYYISTPGYLIPHVSYLGKLVDSLPAWCKRLYSDQTVWQWIALLLCVLTVAFSFFVVYFLFRFLAKRVRSPLGVWMMLLVPVINGIIVNAAQEFINTGINITGNVLVTIMQVSQIILIALLVWGIFYFCKAVVETIISTPLIPERSKDASLLRISMRILTFLIGVWIIIKGLQDLGADMVPLLASLGVGGLAVALAAQKTIANFIGSLILFANKPVQAGDFFRYGDQIGTLENIGLLSTRIRSLERTIVTVPNAELSDMQLDNYTKRDQRLFRTTLQLRYETTPEQMRYVLAQLRELLLRHPKVTPDPARVRFIGYGDYSKDVEVFAYLRCQDHNVFLAIREDILLRMEDIINEAGTGFAFPSQTAYLAQDTGLDTKQKDHAEKQVKQWRSAGKLPFPEFENKVRKELSDTLDFPPKGSPSYTPPRDSSGSNS